MGAAQPFWFQLAVDEHGNPTYLQSPKQTRTQREFLWKVSQVHQLRDLDEVERELLGSLSGVEREDAYGYSRGGAWSFTFRLDGRAIVAFEYDSEAEGDDRYPVPARELEMPLVDFAELFRAWAASMRYWRSVGGYVGVPVPRGKWPACYPPPGAGRAGPASVH